MNLYALLDKSLKLHHDRIAVTDDDGSHRYARLGQRVNEIASALFEAGCQSRTRVCLAVGHRLDLVASVLAVLRLGATYVPIDTRNPVDRIRYIVDDSEATMVICSAEYVETVGQLGLVELRLDGLSRPGETVPTVVVPSSELAYILYTSGSTGRPKGVGITHGNLLNYVRWASDRYLQSPDDRIALYTTLAFDFTVTCLFPPLIAGASIGIYDGVADPMAIQRILADEDVNVVKITPSYLYLLSHLLNGHRHIRRLIVGGEDLTAELAAKVHAQLMGSAEIVNEYGPTEATVGCITHTFDPAVDRDGSVPIGEPIPGMRAYVVNKYGDPVADGEEGEILLSGKSVAPGYLRPESHAFTDNPFDPGTVVYRTGDIARRGTDGNLLFIGRKDDQVKIRGNRVELSEVSAAILNHPMVASAYVTAVREHGSRALAAVVTGDPGLTEALLQKHLAQQLPGYAVPTSLKVIDALPLTFNQKVDRDAVLTIFRNGEATR
ncbi:amino acid adenylation domain-containing protein [Streptomyces sp. DG2A-72]|uniref:amino acid adenylation domain-containing protein n=1 Tax=Streptomyces sp. DG2A-72 TaxID=3051386 RepID=UPI00265BFC2C|nr:amino acid adenylation domain-containing protein [Streptomyces sp. DG2A-72]MDO0930786.1 amino acid adenylation domain-containing protein [Streptomyces sp. DG2A-72]